ncbi:FKBP-type peptidyl-prolyl cis-trans isomerase [uncultured Proteiniphilum sp.]|uniref:FKBP-type peptidyl-prolyl cis-trans isomerase n=1 Tax=uncultured Proteiniphilum sp. TaxID=497637 RepID=UPI0026294A47|nr:FKBP-type peptidyl-prolyl cis-trans isomerase [uncultured Proteiniphilum sp.]
MKKQLSLIISLCAAILFASCDKTETFDDKWKLDNEAQFNTIANDPAYEKIESASKQGFIMYTVIESGNGATPFFNETVKVRYTGWFKRDWSRLEDTYKDDQGNTIYNKVVFDSTERNTFLTLKVNQFVDGFSTALQHMQVGDKWEIWIPWKLGYGATKQGNIEAYTTLVFEVELVGIVKE